MARFSGASTALKLFQTFLYALEFCCAGLILAIYSYFLSIQAVRDIPIPTWHKAVTGMSGAGVLYTAFAVLLTCCLGGKMFFAFVAIVLDILFAAAFIAIAVLTRSGASSCSGSNINSPIGRGAADQKYGYRPDYTDREITYSISLGTACRLNTSVFAVAIIGAFLFIVSALVQLFLGRRHQKDQRYGPSPANNYTSGPGKTPFWRRRGRKPASHNTHMTTAAGAAPVAAPVLATDHHIRPSHDTAYTGSTVAGPNSAMYDAHGKPVHGYADGANPYGYNDTTTTTHHGRQPHF